MNAFVLLFAETVISVVYAAMIIKTQIMETGMPLSLMISKIMETTPELVDLNARQMTRTL